MKFPQEETCCSCNLKLARILAKHELRTRQLLHLHVWPHPLIIKNKEEKKKKNKNKEHISKLNKRLYQQTMEILNFPT